MGDWTADYADGADGQYENGDLGKSNVGGFLGWIVGGVRGVKKSG